MRPMWNASGRCCRTTTCNVLPDPGSAKNRACFVWVSAISRWKASRKHLLALSKAVEAV
jgi:hypothetical protein